MKTNYLLNKNELIINLEFFYEFLDNQNKIENIRKYINNIIANNNINFKGNKIIVYKDGLLIGVFYLTNYYLNKFLYNKNNYLTEINSYFEENNCLEITNNNLSLKKILSI